MIEMTLKKSWTGAYKKGSSKYFYIEWLEEQLQEVPKKIKMYMSLKPFEGSKRFTITVNYHKQANPAGWGEIGRWKSYSMSCPEEKNICIQIDLHDLIMTLHDSTIPFYLYLGFTTYGRIPIAWQSDRPPIVEFENFKCGDVVKLKSGGPDMNVTKINEDESIKCMFVNNKGTIINDINRKFLMYAPPDD